MKKLLLAIVTTLIVTHCAFAQENLATPKPILTVKAEGIGADGYIDPEFAFCVSDALGHSKEGHNKSVGLSWSKGPAGTKSYAIIAVDSDVPTDFSTANQDDKTIAVTQTRRDFYHWILFDIPADKTSIPAYTDSQAISKNGKSEIKTPYGIRGVNDYATFMAGNPERKGVYAGYDGPCPPWNDELVHNYHFRIFALDVASLTLNGAVKGEEVMRAIAPHVLAAGEVIGKYTLNHSLLTNVAK